MSDENGGPWLQLTLEAGDYSPEQLEDALLGAGALAVTLRDAADEPVLEPAPGETPLWSRTRVTGLFDGLTDIQVVKRHLCGLLATDTLPELGAETLAERDWVRAWLEDFRPMRFGRRLWVCPWDSIPPDPQAVNIRLDPGLAFGTGTHPTTALCLEWLDAQSLSGACVIDYGCGSGILTIAAARLGAQRVYGVDIDPQALLACDRNAADNGVADRIEVHKPETLPELKADVVVANILAGTLVALAPQLAALTAPGGRLAVSGILDTQAEAVADALSPWFEAINPRHREDWVLLEGVRRFE